MSAPLGYEALKQLARELGRPASTLYVLTYDNDPFWCGCPSHVARAEWFAALWRQHMPARGGHLRRLHYRLVVQPSPVPMLDGKPYQNTVTCWTYLCQAGKWARNLDLLDADDFDDKKTLVRRLFMDCSEGSDPVAYVNKRHEEVGFGSVYLSEPRMPELPIWALYGFRRIPQRYLMEIWVEKSEIEDVCIPLAHEYGMNYCGFAGQPGMKPCRELVERAEEDGRPVRIFYISDFDPQGENMPIAVARKVEFVLAERGLDLDIEVIPVALTRQQCIDLKLPRSPIKETDRGKGRFEERHGEGATELAALESLHPGLLRRFLLTEIKRYYDPTLEKRVDEQNQALRDEIDDLNDGILAGDDAEQGSEFKELKAELEAIHEELKPIRKRLAPIAKRASAWRERAAALYQTIVEEMQEQTPDFSSVEWPEPAAGDEHPDPLFDSTRDYVDQIAVYKRHQRKPTEKRERGYKRKPNGEAAR